MEKICGTCARWELDAQLKRPPSIRTLNNGTCKFNGKPRKAQDMKGCFGHKFAGEEELGRRGYFQEQTEGEETHED